MTNWGDGIGVTTANVANVTALSSKFTGNTSIVHFDELKYFTNLKWLENDFSNCTNLLSVDLRNMTGLSSSAFNSCSKLVYIGDMKLTSTWGAEQFRGCTNLIGISAEKPWIDLSQIRSFDGNSYSMFSQCSSITKVILPKYCTVLSKYMFEYNTSLLTVEGDNSLTEVTQGAFLGCTKLQSISLTSSCIKVGQDSFSGCSSLVSLGTISAINSVGVRAFFSCTSLTALCDLSAITNFPASCFDSCSKLNLDLSANSVLTVARYAFCSTKITNINLANCTSILNGAFYNCKQLSMVLNAPNLTILGANSINTQNESGTFNGSGITGIENLGTIQYIPIGYPQGERSQFGFCTSLRYVKLPSTLLGIGDTSFRDCSALEYVICNATTPPTLGGNSVFYNTNLTFKIYVPDASVSTYKAATNWSNYASRIFSLTQFNIDFPNG